MQETQLRARGGGRFPFQFLGPAEDDADFGWVGVFEGSHEEMLTVRCDVIIPNPDFTRYSFIIRELRRPAFKRWALIAGDCIHNLRSALDHLVYAIARSMNLSKLRRFVGIGFPSRSLRVKGSSVTRGVGSA
jgi:hypothetical protein